MRERCADLMASRTRISKNILPLVRRRLNPGPVHCAVETPDMKQTLTPLATVGRFFASRSTTLLTDRLVMEVPHNAEGGQLCKLLLPCLAYCP